MPNEHTLTCASITIHLGTRHLARTPSTKHSPTRRHGTFTQTSRPPIQPLIHSHNRPVPPTHPSIQPSHGPDPAVNPISTLIPKSIPQYNVIDQLLQCQATPQAKPKRPRACPSSDLSDSLSLTIHDF
ncbi:hypothetical protein K491DRAFT_688113 [Lophiostoma macrostomum CBS 122681]|uniref:Uncharacterized protein n=1 Tax=Lophiostoma macrostomum CBS 122681 TaxID=1314788 RepID=A0A6A6TLF5_9PLEO|nr:hypothetical protein K491DRAFT_688113 [Lophiostoma macrostomum CBS 122681]